MPPKEVKTTLKPISEDPWLKLLDIELSVVPNLKSKRKVGRPPGKFMYEQFHTNLSVDTKSTINGLKDRFPFVNGMNQIISYAVFMLHSEIKNIPEEELSSIRNFYELTKLIESKRSVKK